MMSQQNRKAFVKSVSQYDFADDIFIFLQYSFVSFERIRRFDRPSAKEVWDATTFHIVEVSG